MHFELSTKKKKMVQLNGDVLYLISKELRYNIYSCLYVSKTWCEIFVSRLWEDPWKNLKRETWEYLKRKKERLLLNVIISHLSEESRDKINNLISMRNSYRKPLFNYIRFCKHLNTVEIEGIISSFFKEKNKFRNEISTIIYEILKLFIDENRIITHLYIYDKKIYNQIKLIPGAKHCFSKLQFLNCNSNLISKDIADLTEMSELIEELELFISKYNHEIVKLIKTPKKLLRICLKSEKLYSQIDKTFYTVLESSLMLHSDNIQYYESNIPPVTDILSSFLFLKVLELQNMYYNKRHLWNCLENLSFPLLQILRTKGIPPKFLISIIENTHGDLIEIKIDEISNINDEFSDKLFIRTVKRNYPNLKLFYDEGEFSKNMTFITPSAHEAFSSIAGNLSDVIIESNIIERLQLLNVAFERSNSRAEFRLNSSHHTGTNRTKFLFVFSIMLIFYLLYLFKPFLFNIMLIFFLLYLFKPFLFFIMLISFLLYIIKPFLFIIMLISFIFYLFKP
jgi:hypothetical protein